MERSTPWWLMMKQPKYPVPAGSALRVNSLWPVSSVPTPEFLAVARLHLSWKKVPPLLLPVPMYPTSFSITPLPSQPSLTPPSTLLSPTAKFLRTICLTARVLDNEGDSNEAGVRKEGGTYEYSHRWAGESEFVDVHVDRRYAFECWRGSAACTCPSQEYTVPVDLQISMDMYTQIVEG